MKRVTDYFATVPAKRVSATIGRTEFPRKTAVTKEIKKDVTKYVKEDPKKTTKESVDTDTTLTNDDLEWKKQWIAKLSPEERELLDLEITTLDNSWLKVLSTELTKPYFLNLKRFLAARYKANQVFPPVKDIYAWSRLTPLHSVKVLVLGQDPYHNVGQAHGLAFSVRPPTRPPPSLVNIYTELKTCYSDFEIPSHGSLVKWAAQGVLMLNACLTVDAHNANSHAQKGWEQFTEQAIKEALKYNPHVVVMAWGSPAARRVDRAAPGPQHLVLRSVHPSPLSASRGWFGTKHFVKANDWLTEKGMKPIDWHLIPPSST